MSQAPQEPKPADVTNGAPMTADVVGAGTIQRSRAKRREIGRASFLGIAAAVFICLGLLWWLVTGTGLVKPLILPSPSQVWSAIREQVDNGELWSDIAISLFRVVSGFLIAGAMAIPVGVLMGRFRLVEAMLEPLMDFVRYMPVVAFVPLTIVWVGISETQKILVIWLGTFFPLVLMIMDSVRRVPLELVDLGRTFGMPGRRILRRIVLRSAFPEIWDSLRICIGWAWTWVVLAELVAANSGMGYRITVGQRYLETSLIIGYVLILGVLGLATDQIFRLGSRLLFHYQSERPN